jgi:hypothetical protein
MYQKGYNSIVVPYDAESSRELGDDHWGLWRGEEGIGKEIRKNGNNNNGWDV